MVFNRHNLCNNYSRKVASLEEYFVFYFRCGKGKLAYKFELVKTGHFWYSDTPEVMSGKEWDEAFHCNRICLYVVLREKESGKEFAFMNTHFGFGDGGQVKSVKLLASYAEKLAPLPIFVTGDFNAFPNSPAYAELIKPLVYKGKDATYMPVTPDEYDTIANALVDEVKSNYENYKKSYEKPMPFYIGTPQLEGGKLSLVWEVAYSFEVESITYTFELARDYNFKDPIVKETGLTLPRIKFDTLPEGQYFIRVIASDEGGDTQTAFDSYITENGKIYGTKCFYVDKDGQIVEDVYVEE